MLLKGKKALIMGVANNRSIAYGISSAFAREGARLAFSYAGDAIKKRVEPICEELGGEFTFPCDVSSDAEIAAAAEKVKEKWGKIDVLVHSVAYAPKEELAGRYLDTSRDGFRVALDISAYSLVGLCRAFEPLMDEGSSVICMTYFGAQKLVPNYNVMGVAKAALEASVRYLASDLGEKGVRINAISAGPIKTLAASGISDFRVILDHIEKFSPLRRNVTIDQVGNAALFLASDLASGVTGDVLFVDSANVCLGEGLLVRLAVQLRAAGKTLVQIATDLEHAKEHLHLVAAIDDLKYLRKGGRLPAAVAVAGGMLGIKPLITIKEGKVAMAGKARGLPGAYVALFKKVEELGGISAAVPALAGYTLSAREVQPIQTYLQDNLQCAEPLVRQIGCVIGTHAGPGAFGLAFFDQGLEL